MTTVLRAGDGEVLVLPGRSVVELVSGSVGGYGVTVRYVQIPPEGPEGSGRGPHRHEGCEEVMLVVQGSGDLHAGPDVWPVREGDTVVVSPGVPHQTRNTGDGDLILMCVFPIPNVGAVSSELPEL